MSDPAPSPPPSVDPAAVVAELKATVARRRAAGEYPRELLERLDAEFSPVEEETPLDAQAHLETVRPLLSSRRAAGRAAVLAKRVIRRLVAWYVRPIAEDQTRFNFGAVRRLYDLEDRLARLEDALHREEATAPRPPDPPVGPGSTGA